MLEASCFQARSVGADGTLAGLAVGPSAAAAVARMAEAVDGEEGVMEALFSAGGGKLCSEVPFAAPPSVRKWKLQRGVRRERERETHQPPTGTRRAVHSVAPFRLRLVVSRSFLNGGFRAIPKTDSGQLHQIKNVMNVTERHSPEGPSPFPWRGCPKLMRLDLSL